MKLLIGALWIVSVTGAYWYAARQANPTPASDILVRQNKPELSVEGINDTATSSASITAPTSSNTGSINLPQQPGLIDEAVRQTTALMAGDGWGRTMSSIAKAYAIVSELDAGQTLEALAQLEFGNDPESMQIALLFLNRLAELAPLQAVDFVTGDIKNGFSKEAAMAAVIGTWAGTDPQAALAWYLSQSEEITGQPVGQFALGSLYRSLATRDARQAIDSLEASFDEHDFSAISMAIGGIARALTKSEEFEYLIDRVQMMDNDGTLETVFASWIKKAPDEALARLDLLDDLQRKDEIEERVFRNWLMMNPEEATAIYMQRSAPEQRQARAQVVVESMSYNQPEQALHWLNRQTDIDSAPLTTVLLRRSTFRDPQFADQHLHLINDKAELARLSSHIYQSYSRYSQARADEFLSRQQPHIREQVLNDMKKVKEAQANR